MKLLSIKAGLMPALAALALVASACHSSGSTTATRGAGAIVLSQDDSRLYIVDTDNNQLVVFNRASAQVEKTVSVGKGPEKAIVGADGRVFVSNRFSRSVSVVDPVEGKEVTRIAVGSEPTGLSLSADGRTLAVANTTSNTVSLVDTAALAVVRTIPTDADPSGVLIHPNGKLYVTHLRNGSVSVFDAKSGVATRGPMQLTLNQSKTGGEPRLPGQPTDPIVGDNGHVYVPHVQSKQSPTPTSVASPGGAYAGGGQPGSVPVVATGIATIDTNNNDRLMNGAGLEAFASAFNGCNACGVPGGASTGSGGSTGDQANQPLDQVPPVIMTTINQQPMSGPSAIAMEPNGRFLYITNMNSGNVSIVSTDGSVPGSSATAPTPFGGASLTNGVIALVKVGAGPKGIAITSTGDRAYVYNSFDESISVLGAVDGQVQEAQRIPLGITSPLSPQQQLGRRLFFAADDTRMTNPASGGISCASCHPTGREDGRTWIFSEGPRNTPTLAGRHLLPTAPFHWDGLLTDTTSFNRIVQQRMGGSGEDGSSDAQHSLQDDDFNAIFAYLDSVPAPDNPNLKEDGTPVNAEAAARGKAIFETKAGCAVCHSGADFTDNGFHNVGTQTNHQNGDPNGPIELFPNDVNTPTLHNIFFSAPYLHDGSANTLADRVANDEGGQHGTTSGLTDAERSDLVEYLKTL